MAVLHGGGDFRAASRELGNALREARAARRALDRLPLGTASGSSLTEFCLPLEWLSFLEFQGGIGAFFEAATQALGGELHPEEAGEVAGRAVEETLGRLRAEGVPFDHDAANGLLGGFGAADSDRVCSILRASVWALAMRAELPVRRFSVKGCTGERRGR